MFQHLGGCFAPCFGSGLKSMFIDVRLVWKQSKTSKYVSSPTNTVGFDTFSDGNHIPAPLILLVTCIYIYIYIYIVTYMHVKAVLV